MRIILFLITLVLLTGCQPNISPPVIGNKPTDSVAKDTVGADTVKIGPVFKFTMIDSIGNAYVFCDGLTGAFPVDNLSEIIIHVTKDKELSYLRVNNKVFYEKEVRAFYRYNTKGDVIISKGNTVLEICRDHDITIEQFKKWNPKINIENLKLNQLVHVGDLPEN